MDHNRNLVSGKRGAADGVVKTGIPIPLTTGDLDAAAKSLRSTIKESFSTTPTVALHANQGGTFDDILKVLDVANVPAILPPGFFVTPVPASRVGRVETFRKPPQVVD